MANMQRLWIPGPLPNLNDIIDARMRVYGTGPRKANAYSKMKATWAAMIRNLAVAQRFRRVESGCFTYLWLEKAKQRDPGNFAGGGQKLVEDALQEAGLLAGDGWRNVLDFRHHWDVNANAPGLLLWVGDRCMEKDDAILVEHFERHAR